MLSLERWLTLQETWGVIHLRLLCLGHCYKFRFLASCIYLGHVVQLLCSSKTLCVVVLSESSFDIMFALRGFTFSSTSTNVFREPYSWTFRVQGVSSTSHFAFNLITSVQMCPLFKCQLPLLAFVPKTWGILEPRSSSAGYLSKREYYTVSNSFLQSLLILLL